MNIATEKDSVVFSTALRYRSIPSYAGTVAMAVGGFVLVGWLLGMRSLLSDMPGYATMKPNTAFCFVLGGLALWLLRFPRSQQSAGINPKDHQIGQVCSLLVASLGLLTLGEYFCNLNLGIDQALLPYTLMDARVLFPGRMSISSAIGFCMLGSSLFFLGTKRARGGMTSQILAVIGLADVMIAFIGYVYGVEGLYGTTLYAAMAVQTTLLFGVLFVGILFARADDGVMSVITDHHSGGQMARFFLPLAFTVPFLVGWLRLKGQQAGLYGTEFGLTLLVTSNIIIFTVLVWLSAKWQNTRAVQLAGSENEFRTMLDAIPQLAWIARPDGYIYWYNQQWYDYTNTTLEQMQGAGWTSVHDPAVLPFVNERWCHCLLSGEPFEFEFPLRGGDGHFRWFLTRCFPLKGGDGKILRWFGTNTDISRKREAEEEIRRLNTDLEKRVMERTEELVAAKARLQDVLDAATHVAVIATNAEGIITVFNSGAEQMLGYTSEVMVGKHPPNIFHLASEIMTRGLELTQEVGRPVEGFDVFVEKARNGQFEEREWTYVRKDGSLLSVNLVVTAQQDAAGGTTGFLGVAMDVTARKKSEETLRVSEERFRLIVDSVKDYALFMLDQEGHVVSWNAGAERIKGYKEAEIIGKHFSCLYLPEDIQAGRPEKGLQIAAQHGHYSEEGWRVRKNGTRFLADVVISAIRDKAGKLRGFAKVTRDITDRRKVETALQRQALLLDMANDTIFIRDGEDCITYWNQGAQRLYGWSKEEALGQITHSLLHTQFPQPLDEIKAQVLEEGHWEGELVHTRRDGTKVIVVSGWTLQRDESNRTTSIIEMNYDITARRKAENELEESREQLSAILNGSVDGIIVYKSVRDEAGALRDFRFSMVNPATEKLIGQNATDLLGHTLLEKFPNVVIDGLFEKFASIVDKNETLDFEHLSSASDSPRWYRLAGVKLGDGLAVSYNDISTRKRYERQLQEAKERAELTDSAKSDFLANMSHEIRTPMNGVIGMTGLLLDTSLDTEQRRLAETTRNSAESLLSLINDILDFSKIEAGQMVFEEIDFDLRKVVEDTLEMLAGQAQAKGIELVGGIGPEAATKLRGDPGRVHQLLTNLIANAIKFTPSGEVAARVTTEMETERDVFVRIEIKDTGIGIRPEIRDRLFQSFVQGDSSTSRKFGGTGLGLAICKRLAEAMNGTIGVESAPGQGSKFWVTMRIARQIAAKTSPQFVPEFGDSRVLIVDDNETSRLFLHKQIVDWQLRNGCASTGQEALAILRQAVAEEAPYSVAIIDLQMPVLDGLTLIRKINADPQLGATRLILLIPFGRSFDAGELKAVNIAACCIKPVRQSALLDCLVQVLARSTTTGATCLDEPYLRSDDFPKPRSERVLLAEDNVVNQEVALGNLRKLGYSADVVANGLEVLDALERKRYDIILMDCQMPELDGYKTTKEIRRREQKDHRTWIIAMTANVMVGDREKCIAAGMDDYVSKPSRRMELRAALNRVATTTVRQLDDDDVLRTLIEEGEDAFDRLVGLFFASAPASLAEMKRALAKTDTVDLVQSAHNLKGSCSNFGGSSLRELCAQIEQWGDGGQPGDIADLIVSVEKELAKLIERLKTYRKAGIP